MTASPSLSCECEQRLSDLHGGERAWKLDRNRFLIYSPRYRKTKQQFVHKPYEFLDPEEVLKEKR